MVSLGGDCMGALIFVVVRNGNDNDNVDIRLKVEENEERMNE